MPRSRTLVAALGLSLALAVPAVMPAAAEPARPYPPAALGISYDSTRLDILDPATGDVIGSAGADVGIFLDADYSTVRGEIFTVVTRGDETVIRHAPLFHPGASGVVAHGRRVAVSPDGRLLARVYDPDGPAKGTRMEAVAVRDLDTGAERHFAGPPLPAGIPEDIDDPIIHDLAFSPDSTRLAFDYFDAGETFVVDLASARSLADAAPVTGVVGSRSPAFLADDTLAVIDVEGQVRAVDLFTGKPLDVLLDGYAEEIDPDDAGRLAVKLVEYNVRASDTTPFALVGTDGQVTRLRKPYHTLVW